MTKYKYRHRETYKDVRIDIKANSTKELAEKIQKKYDQIDRQFLDHDTSLSRLIDLYLETYKKYTVSLDAYRYCESIGNTILRGIGNLTVSKIKPMQAQTFLNHLTDHKESYVKKIYQMTRQLFRHAYKNGLTITDYSVVFELPKGKPSETGRSLTAHERLHLLKMLNGHRGELFCKIMLYCGLRPGEVMALRWKDVDFSEETLKVVQSIREAVLTGGRKVRRQIERFPYLLI